jgi:hypothetical protein
MVVDYEPSQFFALLNAERTFCAPAKGKPDPSIGRHAPVASFYRSRQNRSGNIKQKALNISSETPGFIVSGDRDGGQITELQDVLKTLGDSGFSKKKLKSVEKRYNDKAAQDVHVYSRLKQEEIKPLIASIENLSVPLIVARVREEINKDPDRFYGTDYRVYECDYIYGDRYAEVKSSGDTDDRKTKSVKTEMVIKTIAANCNRPSYFIFYDNGSGVAKVCEWLPREDIFVGKEWESYLSVTYDELVNNIEQALDVAYKAEFGVSILDLIDVQEMIASGVITMDQIRALVERNSDAA